MIIPASTIRLGVYPVLGLSAVMDTRIEVDRFRSTVRRASVRGDYSPFRGSACLPLASAAVVRAFEHAVVVATRKGLALSATRARGASADVVWGAIAVLVPVGATLLLPTQALDLAYHVRAGEIMLRSGAVLRSDLFSYTVLGEPWLDQQWGAQVLFALVFQAGGWLTLDVLRGVCVGVSAWFIYRSCVVRGARPRMASILTLGGWMVAAPVLVQLRPQLVGTLAFCCCVWLLTTRRMHPGRVWFVPVVVVVWANIHGSYPLVFVLLAIATVEDLSRGRGVRRLVWVSAASAIATVVTPFGPSVWAYVRDLATNPLITDQIGEWGPPSRGSITGLLFFASLFVVVLVLGVRRRSVSVGAMIAFVVFGVMSLIAVRAVVWWALTMPVFLSEVLAAGENEVSDEARSPLGVAVLGALGAFVILALAWNRGTDPDTGGPAMLSFAPESLVAVMRTEVTPRSNVFASQVHASWAEFSAPDFRYAVDSRVELFPDAIWNDYFRVSNAEDGWETIVDRDGVEALLLDPDQAEKLLDALGEHPGWRLLAENEDGAVYVRS